MTSLHSFPRQPLNWIHNQASLNRGATAALLLLGFLSTARAQNLPVAHWIKGSGQDAVTVLNGGGVFITSFKGNDDLKVTQLSGQVNSIYLDVFGGGSPGNNPTWITDFVGLDTNGTGDGTAGDINDLEMSSDDTGSLQFDFQLPLTPNDRILLSDVDLGEAYLLKAYVRDSSSHYAQVSLTNWIAQDFSGSTGQMPDSTWPVWNAFAGTLTSGTSDTLDEEVVVLVPDRNIDRFVITKQTGSGYTTAMQFFSPLTITDASPLPAGSVGVAYFQALAAISGTMPYNWTLASGTLPAGLQLSNAGVISGKPISAATASFTVKVTDKNGITATRLFSLSITVPDATKPTITITSPISGQRWSNAVFTVKGTAKDNQQVQAVWCQTNGVWGTAKTSNGWTNWTVDVALVPGTNVIKACAADTSWNWSPTQSVSLVYIVTDKLRVQATGACTMSPNYSNAVLEIGKSYSTTVTPGKGLVLSNWVGTVLGKVVTVSNASKLTFTMQSNLVLQANIIANPFTPVKGTYNGLFAQFPRAQGNSGFFTLSLTTNGAYSGSLRQGTNTYPFTGQFDLGGIARQVVSRPNTNPWVAGMGLDLAARQVRGWVSNGISGGGVAELVADRAVFDARTNPATRYAGKCTVDIPGGTNEDGTVWLGDSYLTLTVDTGGKVTYSGYLADGTPVGPASVPVSGIGTVPVYAPLYTSKGSIFGWLTFDSGQPSAGLTGWLNWIKHANAGACYPAGLTNQVTVEGARYTPPANTTTRVIEMTNGAVIFEGGNLTAPLTNAIMLTASNKVIDLSLANKLSLSVTVSNGVFSGSVREPGLTKSNVFKGVLLQDESCGYGYFLETNLSGRVLLLPNGGGGGTNTTSSIPWIRHIDILPSQGQGQMRITGVFGPDPGPTARSVVVAGIPMNVTSWAQLPDHDSIVCDLPLQGNGAVGNVCVTVRHQASNLVTISEYRPNFIYTFNQGPLNVVVNCQLRLRADLHVPRMYRGGPLVPGTITVGSDQLSTATYTGGGSFSKNNLHEEWSGSGTASGDGSSGSFVIGGGLVDQSSWTLRFYLGGAAIQGMTQKVTDLSNGSVITNPLVMPIGQGDFDGFDPQLGYYIEAQLEWGQTIIGYDVTILAKTWQTSSGVPQHSGINGAPEPTAQIQLTADCEPNPSCLSGD